MASLGRAYIEIIGDVSRFAPQLRKQLQTAFAGAALGAVAAAASGQLIGLAGALLQVAGAAVAIPAAVAVAGAAIGGLAVATKGLGDSFKKAFATDAKAFEKSLETLSPKARELAREFRALVPELRGIKFAAQDAFTGELIGNLSATVKVLSGPLSDGLRKVAAGWGEAARQMLAFAREAKTVGVLNQVFDTTFGSLSSLAGALNPLLAGFRDLIPVALPLIQQMGDGFASVLATFGAFLTRLAESGDGLRLLDQAVKVIGQLGSLLLSVAGILGTVFSAAANSASGGLLTGLTLALDTVNRFLKSTEGQTALLTFFNTLGALSSALAPVFTNLLGVIGQILPPLGAIFAAVVPALASIVSALGPALDKIAGPLVAAFGSLAAAIAQIAGPTLDIVATTIGALLTLLEPLLPLVATLITPFGVFAAAISALGSALEPIVTALGPVLIELVNALVTAVLPLATAIGLVASKLAGPFGKIIALLGEILAPIIEALAPIVTDLVDAFMPFVDIIVLLIDPLLEIVRAFLPLISLIAALLPVATAIIEPIAQLLAVLVGLLANAAIVPLIELIARALGLILTPLTLLLGPIEQFTSTLDSLDWGAIGRAISSAFGSAWNAVKTFFVGIGRFFGELPGKARAAGAALIKAFGDGVRSVAGFAGDVASAIVGFIKGQINNVLRGINIGIEALDNVLPFGLPRIPLLAEGDVVRRPMVVGLGEDGPEVVIPLTKPRRARELVEESGLANLLGMGGGAPNVLVKVFLGAQELTALVRDQVVILLDDLGNEVGRIPREA